MYYETNDNDKSGQHTIFIVILCCILFLLYTIVPSNKADNSTEQSAKKSINKTRHLQKKDIDTSHNIAQKSYSPEETIEETPKETIDTHADEKKIEIKPEVFEKKTDSGTSQEKLKQTTSGSSSLAAPVIAMNDPGYAVHKKGIVNFTHEKHIVDYAISCGQCHHDENAAPLELTKDDKVQKCIECHKETQKPKGEKLDKKTKIAKYHFEALHANCIGCHKTYNIEKGDPKGKKPAPTVCGACHPKNKK